MQNGTLVRGLGFGVVGGLLGTLLMDVVMIFTFVSVGEPTDFFFSMVGAKLGGGAMIGIVLHNIIGMTGGIVFALLVMNVPALEMKTMRTGLILGVAAGAFTIPVGCIPLGIWLDKPILGVIAFSTLPHLVWGSILGWVVGYGLISLRMRS